MLWPRSAKLNREFGHHQEMAPIDFRVTRSKVKVTVTCNLKKVLSDGSQWGVGGSIICSDNSCVN